MTKRIVFLTILTILVFSYYEVFYHHEEIIVKNFDKTENFVLVDAAYSPNHAVLYAKGDIEGKLEISVMHSSLSHKPEAIATVTGKIDTLIRGGDWYNDTLFVTLKPLTKVEGRLKLKYRIWSF